MNFSGVHHSIAVLFTLVLCNAEGGSRSGVEIGAQGTLVSPDINLLDNTYRPIGNAASAEGNYSLAVDDGVGPSNVDLSLPDGSILPGMKTATVLNPLSLVVPYSFRHLHSASRSWPGK